MKDFCLVHNTELNINDKVKFIQDGPNATGYIEDKKSLTFEGKTKTYYYVTWITYEAFKPVSGGWLQETLERIE